MGGGKVSQERRPLRQHERCSSLSAHIQCYRLRLQHELTKTNLDGHVLDPNLPPLQPGMAVADVACGTGAWLLDAVDLCPGITAEGLDVNIDNVPPKEWLPQHVSFHHFDLLRELSDEYASRYDVINAQFLTSFVRDEHIGLAIGNLVKMLSTSPSHILNKRRVKLSIRSSYHRAGRPSPVHRV